MKNSDLIRFSASRKQAAIVCAVAILAMLCWLEARALASKCASHHAIVRQIEQMSADAERIAALRNAPRLANEVERPNDELLAQIRDSMSVAGIAEEQWIGNDPTQPVRLPRSPYKRLSVRLSFGGLTLRQLVQFAYDLTGKSSALHIPRVRLGATSGTKGEAWDTELTLSYLIYAPYQRESAP